MCAAHEPLVPRVMPPQPTPDHPLPPHTSSASYSEIYNFLSSLMVDQKPPSLSDESECEVESSQATSDTRLLCQFPLLLLQNRIITTKWKSIKLQTLLVELQTLLVELQTLLVELQPLLVKLQTLLVKLQTLLVKLQTLLGELQTWQYLSDMQTFVCQTPADKGLSRRCGVSTQQWEGLAR